MVDVRVAVFACILGITCASQSQSCSDINLTGLGIASSSSTAGGPLDFKAEKAFDRDGRGGVERYKSTDGNFDYTTVFYAEENVLPVVLRYFFPTSTVVCGYALISVPWVEKALTDTPLSWTFEGSHGSSPRCNEAGCGGDHWEVLHRVESQDSWGPYERRRFELSTPAAFQNYRLRISRVQGRVENERLNRFVGVAEMEIFGLESPGMAQTIASGSPAAGDLLLGEEKMREGRDIIDHWQLNQGTGNTPDGSPHGDASAEAGAELFSDSSAQSELSPSAPPTQADGAWPSQQTWGNLSPEHVEEVTVRPPLEATVAGGGTEPVAAGDGVHSFLDGFIVIAFLAVVAGFAYRWHMKRRGQPGAVNLPEYNEVQLPPDSSYADGDGRI